MSTQLIWSNRVQLLQITRPVVKNVHPVFFFVSTTRAVPTMPCYFRLPVFVHFLFRVNLALHHQYVWFYPVMTDIRISEKSPPYSLIGRFLLWCKEWLTSQKATQKPFVQAYSVGIKCTAALPEEGRVFFLPSPATGSGTSGRQDRCTSFVGQGLAQWRTGMSASDTKDTPPA